MGWEVLNANEEVDIRNHGLSAFEKLPIGNYVEDLAHVKKLGSSTKGKQPPSEEENRKYWAKKEQMYEDAKNV